MYTFQTNVIGIPMNVTVEYLCGEIWIDRLVVDGTNIEASASELSESQYESLMDQFYKLETGLGFKRNMGE